MNISFGGSFPYTTANTTCNRKGPIEILELIYLVHVTLCTLVGNSFVLIAFVFGPRSIRCYTNYFVLNLSLSDLLVGCVSLPFWTVFRVDASLITDNLYNVIFPIDVLSGVTSISCLAVISLERMIAVKFTTAHFNLTKRPVLSVIFTTWLIGVIFATTMYVLPKKRTAFVKFTIAIFFVGFLIPFIVIIISYVVIFNTSSNMMESSNKTVIKSREVRVAKTICVVIGCFLVCWMPFFILNIIYVICKLCHFPRWPIYLTKSLHYSNSMLNFFVYSLRSPEFRHFYKRLLCGKNHHRKIKRQIDASRKLTATSDLSHFPTEGLLLNSTVRQRPLRLSFDVPMRTDRLFQISDVE